MDHDAEKMLLDSATSVAIFLTNNEGVITVFNAGAEKLFGYSADEIIAKKTALFFHDPEDIKLWQNQLASKVGRIVEPIEIFSEILNQKIPQPRDWHYKHKDGHKIRFSTTISILKTHEGETTGLMFMANPKEITNLTSLQDLTDSSTMQKILLQEFKRTERENSELSFLKIDIDHYKNYLSHYGEKKANRCLNQIAMVLNDRIQRAGDLLCYLGNDEFAVILPNTNQGGAIKLAETLRLLVSGLELEHKYSPSGKCITISIGVATYPGKNIASFPELINQANHALESAKFDGRNCTRINEEN